MPCTSQSSSQVATVLSSEPPTERPSTQAFLRYREGPHFSLLGNNRYPTDLIPLGSYLIERLPQSISVPSCVEVKVNSLAAARRLQTLVAHSGRLISCNSNSDGKRHGKRISSAGSVSNPLDRLEVRPACQQAAGKHGPGCVPSRDGRKRAIPCLFVHFY